VQLDELYAVLRALKAGEISDDEAMKRLERSPYWVWTAMDPKRKLLVVVDVGCRTLAMAQRVVPQVTRVLAPDCVPLFIRPCGAALGRRVHTLEFISICGRSSRGSSTWRTRSSTSVGCGSTMSIAVSSAVAASKTEATYGR
jgi:hypothetical protein